MALTFPTGTLTVGQTFTNAGVTYTYDGVKWAAGVTTAPIQQLKKSNIMFGIDDAKLWTCERLYKNV